jgi:hypothetical protein
MNPVKSIFRPLNEIHLCIFLTLALRTSIFKIMLFYNLFLLILIEFLKLGYI